MSGWKTWVSAAMSIVWGISGWYMGTHSADVAIGFISAGLGLVGIGHKLEKNATP